MKTILLAVVIGLLSGCVAYPTGYYYAPSYYVPTYYYAPYTGPYYYYVR